MKRQDYKRRKHENINRDPFTRCPDRMRFKPVGTNGKGRTDGGHGSKQDGGEVVTLSAHL